jgi:hypothetical protein
MKKLSKCKHVYLPKQFERWAKKAGLKLTSSSRWNRAGYEPYFIGHGFKWRIDASGLLCRSCKIENFDRWANSEDYEIDRGENEKEFVGRVNHLKSLREVNP